MARQSTDNRRQRRSIRPPAKPYVLVLRARDGRVRLERFKTAADYRVRLAASGAKMQPVSLDELIDLL